MPALLRSLNARACRTVACRQFQGVQYLPGQLYPVALDWEARHHPAYQPGHPDHEELVQVGGENGEEAHALQQRDRLVFGEFEHALVESEPALLTVEVTLLGQRGFGVRRRPVAVVVPFSSRRAHLADTHGSHCPRSARSRKRQGL